MKYFLRYACAFCAMRLLWGFARKHKPAHQEAPVCKQHVSGLLLSIFLLVTFAPLLAAGILGAFINK